MMKVQYRVALAAVIIAVAALVFKWLIGKSTVTFFMAAGPVALQERNELITMVLLMLVVVIPMLIVLYTFAWKYREGNPKAKAADYQPERRHGPWGEIIFWLIPAALVVLLGSIAWGNAYALDPYRPIPANEATPDAQTLEIQVVALPWKWLFIYPAQNIATVNYIEFPAGTPIHFDLTADGPMSSFWIPQLGSQIYAMAAMQTQINLLASEPGDYVGKDTEINGAGYAGMTFDAKSVAPADFAAWVAEAQATSSADGAPTMTLTPDAYDALAVPSENNPPMTYSSVAPGLFDGVVMKDMVPTPAPEVAQTSSAAAMPGMSM